MTNFEVKIRTDYSSVEGIVLDCPWTTLELDGSKWSNLAPHAQPIRKGNHTGVDNSSFLIDQNHFFINNNLSGCTVYNLTDGSSGLVISNSNHNVTATLSGGTDNDWDEGDEYEIWVPRFGDPFQDRVLERPTISVVSGIQQAYFNKANNSNFKIPLDREFISTGWCVAFDYLTQVPVGNNLPIISFPNLEVFRQDGSGNFGYRHNSTSVTGSGDMTAGTWLLSSGSSSGDLYRDGVVSLSGTGSHATIETNPNMLVDGYMEQVGNDVIVDGDMEASGVSAWTVYQSAILTKETIDPKSGTQNIKATYNGLSFPGMDQSILIIGRTYTIRGWGRSDGVAAPSFFNPGGSLGTWNGTTATVWQYFDITFTASSNITRFFGRHTSAGYAEFDDIEAIDQSEATSAWSAGNAAQLSKQASTYEGNQCLRIEGTGTVNPYAAQTVLNTGDVYRITGVARSDGTRTPRITDLVTDHWTGTTSTSWQPFDVTFTASSTTMALIFAGGSAGYVEFDSVYLTRLEDASIAGRIGATFSASAYTEIILAGVFMWRRDVSPLEVDFIYDSLASDSISHSVYSRAQMSLPTWTDDTGTGDEVSRLNAIDGYPHRFYKASIPAGTYRRVQISVSIDGLVVPDSSLGGELFSIDCIEYPSAGKPAVFSGVGWSSIFDIKLSDPGHYTFVVSRPNGGSSVLHLDVEAV